MKYSYDRCSNPVYFNTLSLIICFSAIETLICQREIECNTVYFLWFCKKKRYTIFENRIEIIVVLSEKILVSALLTLSHTNPCFYLSVVQFY